MTDMDILKSKIKLDGSILNNNQKTDYHNMIYHNRDVLSMRDETGTCPQIQVHLKLQDEIPFFIRPYPIRDEKKLVVKREMDRLVRLGIIKRV